MKGHPRNPPPSATTTTRNPGKPSTSVRFTTHYPGKPSNERGKNKKQIKRRKRK